MRERVHLKVDYLFRTRTGRSIASAILLFTLITAGFLTAFIYGSAAYASPNAGAHHANPINGAGSPTLTLSPKAGGPATRLTLHGSSFGAGEQVKLFWNYTGPGSGTLLATATSNSNGSFTAYATVPTGTDPGKIAIAGVGQNDSATVIPPFVLDPPMLALAPLSGSANTPLTVSAFGFAGLEKVKFFWNNSSTPILVTTAGDTGYIKPVTITVPDPTDPGNYSVTAVGQQSSTSITNTYTVVAPAITLNIVSGPVGAAVQVTGQGYAPNETVNILWNYTGPGTGTTVATVNAGPSGAFTTSFTVPARNTSSYAVAAVGASSSNVSQSTFAVSNGLLSNPPIISPGVNATVTGTGFQPNQSVQLYWNSSSGQLLATATSDANGNVNQVVTTPSSASPGAHSIFAIEQDNGQSFTAPVTIDTEWGDFGFDTTHHRQNPYEDVLSPTNVANLTLKWSVTTTSPYEGSPVYADGIVYVATYDGYLDAYNATTGKLQWQFNSHTDFINVSSPLVDTTTNTVFFGTVAQWDGLNGPGVPSPVYALDSQTGTLKWSLIIPANEYSFPTLAFNTIYVDSSHEGGPGYMYALDVMSGHITWQYRFKGGMWGAPAFNMNTDTLFTGEGNPADAVVALNALTGALLWQYLVPNSKGDNDPGSGIALANGIAYANSKNGYTYALNQSDGSLAWSTMISPYVGDVSSPAVSFGGDMVYVGSLNSHLNALDAHTGNILWKTNFTAGVQSSPAVANGVVYIASRNKYIYAVNAQSGKVLWKYNTGDPSVSSPIVVNGWLYCGSNNGTLYAFSF